MDRYADWCELEKDHPDSEARGKTRVLAALKRRRKELKRRRDAELTQLGQDLRRVGLFCAEGTYIWQRMCLIRSGKVKP